MSKPQVGVFYTEEEMGMREAYHVPAIASKVIGGVSAYPGTYVTFTDPEGKTCETVLSGQPHGVIDPFLPLGVRLNGETVLVFVLPKLVSEGVKHYFSVEGLNNYPKVQEVVVEKTVVEYSTDPPKGYALVEEDRLEDLETIERRFAGYDDDDDGCRGCY